TSRTQTQPQRTGVMLAERQNEFFGFVVSGGRIFWWSIIRSLRSHFPQARFWLTSELPTTRQEQYLSGVGGAALRKPVWRSRCLAEISASSCLIGWSRSSEKGVESRPGIFTGHELDSLAQQTHSSA